MTELRYLPDDDDVMTFDATVETATETSFVLDGTYFYPVGGGQPADHGELSWYGGRATVVDVRKDHGDVRHDVEEITGDLPDAGSTVHGTIDAERRTNHKRMHTAQHVVSRVVLDEYGATTAGNQIHADRSRIDFAPVDFSDADIDAVERATNEAIAGNYRVTKAERPRATVEERVDEGRALLDRIPASVDPLRVVEIEEFDLCPCGGTHVDRLGEIGRVTITDCTSKGKDTERIEFELVAE